MSPFGSLTCSGGAGWWGSCVCAVRKCDVQPVSAKRCVAKSGVRLFNVSELLAFFILSLELNIAPSCQVEQFLSLPPMRLYNVAVSLCPSLRCLQVELMCESL